MQICNNHYDAQLDSRSQKDGGSDGVRFLKSTSISVNKTLSFRQTANLLNNNCIASLGVCVCVCVCECAFADLQAFLFFSAGCSSLIGKICEEELRGEID